MFNFGSLKIEKRGDSESVSSFVGIARNINNDLVFRLPKGFKDFPDSDFYATKNLFFRMYRTFKKFETDSQNLQRDTKPTGKDNIESKDNAYRFKDKDDNEVLLYSKISVIENLLEAYQELSLDIIERRIGPDERIDLSKIDRYLHKAIYMPNDIIYIDEMEQPRHIIQNGSNTLIELFCFILNEISNEIEQDVNDRVKDLSNLFKEFHLSHEQSLFNEATFESTIATLKDILSDIDRKTSYKDEDYWRVYEAIESFLYGELDMANTHEDGIFWGISNFYQIWEDMCNTYAFKNFDVLYCDTDIILNGTQVANHKVNGHKIYKKEGFNNPFFIELNDEKRWMRPDLVKVINNINNINRENIFEKYISIIIKNNHIGGRVTFDVLLKDKSVINVYNKFCSRLKSAISSGKKWQGYRIHGARVEGDNKFKNYPKDILEHQKKLLEDACDSSNSQSYKILDWKYLDEEFFLERSSRLDKDITKQLAYEFALQQQENSADTKSQFVIPHFYNEPLDEGDQIGFYVKDDNLYIRLLENGIELFKANFFEVQRAYLSND